MRGKMGKANLWVDPAFAVERSGAKFVKAESAAAFPVDCFGNSALFALNYFLKTGDTMRHRVVTRLNADIAPPHFVRDGSRRTGTKEGVQHKITGVRSNH